MTHLRLALEIRPDYAEAENNLANALNRSGRPAEAVAHYQRSLQLKPNYPTFCSNLGSVLLQLKRPNESLPYLEKAVQGAPKDGNAQNNLGNTLLELGRVDEAIDHYRLVVRLRAHDSAAERAAADYNLANALVRKRRSDEAISVYREAIASRSAFCGRWQKLAIALLKNGSVEEATTFCVRWLICSQSVNRPNGPNPNSASGMLYSRLVRPKRTRDRSLPRSPRAAAELR